MEDEKWTKDFVMEPQRIFRKSFKIAKEIKYAFAPNDMNPNNYEQEHIYIEIHTDTYHRL